MTAEGGDSRPIRYVEHADDGTPTRIIYRASSLGGCERAMIATARGLPTQPHPEWFAEVLEEGNTAEPIISAMWDETTGVATVRQQEELELWVMDVDLVVAGVTYVDVPVVVRAHIDGRADTVADSPVPELIPTLREYKKFRTSTWPNFIRQGCEINLFYPWQLAAMMHAIKADEGDYPLVEMVAGRWEDDTVQEISVHYIDNPPVPLKAIKKKIARIERLLAEGYDPTDPEVVCTENQYPCGFFRLHPSALAGGKQSTKTEFKLTNVPDEIRQLVNHDLALSGSLKGLKMDTDKIESARKEVRRQLQEYLVSQDVGPNSYGDIAGLTVEWTRSERKAYEVKASVRETVQVSMPTETKVKVKK